MSDIRQHAGISAYQKPDFIVNFPATRIRITFLSYVESIVRQTNVFFQGFLLPENIRHSDGEVQISLIDNPDIAMAFKSIAAETGFEQVLGTELARSRMIQFPDQFADVALSPGTICSYYQDGLLLFDPDTLTGRIFFFKPSEYIFHNLYRLLWVYIAQVLGEKGACFLHAAALVKDKKAYVFPGNSGSGKSTIARLCSDGQLYSDDGPVFLKQEGSYRVYPSPYKQVDFGHVIDGNIANTGAVPAGFYFLNKHKRIFLEKVSKKEALSLIIKQHIHFFVHLSPRAKALLFDLFFEVCDTVSAYNLFFYKSRNVWRTVTASDSGGKDDRQKRQRQYIQNALRTAPAV